MSRMKGGLVAVLALGALAVGCGSDDEPAATTQASRAAAAAPSLAGTYERMLTRADIERTDDMRDESTPEQEKPQPGPLELELSGGTLRLTDRGADLTIRQDFSATDDGALRIGAYQAPEEGSFCGPDVSQTASYRWKLTGDVLALEAQQDECADRDSSLSGEWRRR